MKPKRKLVVTFVAVGAMVAGVSLMAVSLETARPGWAAQEGAPAHAFGHHRHGRHAGLGRLCSERRDERLDDMVGFVESFVDFTPEQSAAWDDLTSSLRSGSAKVGATCAELAEQGRPETAPEKLARVERMMETGLTAMREVRPAFDDFYAVLDDQQKQAIDKLARHRRH